jgi:hypothetical protein
MAMAMAMTVMTTALAETVETEVEARQEVTKFALLSHHLYPLEDGV